jgi:hypothetical protein
MPFVSMMDAGARRPMRAGGKRYANPLTVKHGEVVDNRPVTGAETIPADQVRTAPRVVRQPDPKHPGGVPQKSVVAASQARPAADPVVRHVQHSGIPHHRTEPTHRPAESEEQTIINGHPVSKRKLEAFSELLKVTETKIASDPRAVGPAVRELGDQMMKMHLAHVKELNDQALADHEKYIQQAATHARAQWNDETLARPDGHQLISGAKATMAQYAREHPSHAAELTAVAGHSGLGNHHAMLHFASWAGKKQLPTGGTHYAPQGAPAGSQGRAYKAPAGAPSAMSRASRMYK